MLDHSRIIFGQVGQLVGHYVARLLESRQAADKAMRSYGDSS